MGVSGQSWPVLRVICELWDQTWAKPSAPLGYSSTTAWSPISANRGRGRGRVPDSGQIGDGDGGASPPPGKSGTDAPSPSPDKSGTGTGTGTGVSVPCCQVAVGISLVSHGSA